MEGKLKVNYTNTTYRFNDKIYFKGDEIGMNNLKLYDENKNIATINGGIYHDGFRDYVLDIYGTFENFMVLNTVASQNDLYYGRVFATGDFEMLGATENLTITANAFSNKNTKIYIPLEGYEEVEQHDFIRFLGQENIEELPKDATEDVDISGLRIDLNLDINTDAYGEIIFDLKAGDIIRVQGNGKLNLVIDTRGDFNMYGEYEIKKGAYNFTLVNLINKEFEIQPNSTISWNGDPYGAMMKIDATYEQDVSLLPIITDTTLKNSPELKRRYPVIVNMDLKGNLLSPEINYTIDIKEYPNISTNSISMDYVVMGFLSDLEANEQELNRQVFSLLILKKLSPEYFMSDIGQSTGNSVSELLTNQLSYWLSQVDENLEIDIDLSGLDAEAFNTFRLRMSYTLLDGRLRVTREGSFTNDNNTDDLTSIAGEWTVEYLLSEDGNLRIKMYNENNPNIPGQSGSSNTSAGFSLLHTQSFDSLEELFSRKKKGDKR